MQNKQKVLKKSMKLKCFENRLALIDGHMKQR